LEFQGEKLFMGGEKFIIFNFSGIGRPIERGHTGKGKPWAVKRRGRPLTNRQQRLLDALPDYGSRVTVRKGDVSMSDLAALTAKAEVEFTMFTCGSRRLIIRGDWRHVEMEDAEIEEMGARGYKWSGHTHVGENLSFSEGDYNVLGYFDQAQSVIYNSWGKNHVFPNRERRYRRRGV
jgi:hypothetical protein